MKSIVSPGSAEKPLWQAEGCLDWSAWTPEKEVEESSGGGPHNRREDVLRMVAVVLTMGMSQCCKGHIHQRSLQCLLTSDGETGDFKLCVQHLTNTYSSTYSKPGIGLVTWDHK